MNFDLWYAGIGKGKECNKVSIMVYVDGTIPALAWRNWRKILEINSARVVGSWDWTYALPNAKPTLLTLSYDRSVPGLFPILYYDQFYKTEIRIIWHIKSD